MKSKLFTIFVAVCLLTGCTSSVSERHYKKPPTLPYSLNDNDKLIQMAEERFGELTKADRILFTAATAGIWADYMKGSDTNEPNDGDRQSNMQIIEATHIEWLCKNKEAKKLVSDEGIIIIGAEIRGTINLSHIDIPFPLNFSKCVFSDEIILRNSSIKALVLSNSDVVSISADGIDVKNSVFLWCGFRAYGEVRFPAATIGGDFVCEKGMFINEGDVAILADGMNVKGNVFLNNGFRAKGMVSFLGADIGKTFGCNNGEFINKGDVAILADRMEAKGGVFLNNGFKAEGEVRFPAAMIGGDFVCEKGEFINEGGTAILADGMNVKGSAYLRKRFKAEGKVSFIGAMIGGDFNCEEGEFINKEGYAIVAGRIDIKGRVLFMKGKVEGRVDFIGGTVGGHFDWKEVNEPNRTRLDLRNAKVGVLWDDEKSWPAKGNLYLDGFVYENIYDKAPSSAKSRIDWLNRQGEEKFRPGPYEQLAKVLEKMGHSEDAKKILIEKERKMIKLGGLSWSSRLWKRFLGLTICYGYRPLRTLGWIIAIIGIGTGIFWRGYQAGVIVPVEKDAYVSGQGGQLREGYPKFNPLMYAIDEFVPVLDLHMKKYWRPDANKSGKLLRFIPVRGDFVRGYMWVHICLGWILTTLLVVGLTGLVKK